MDGSLDLTTSNINSRNSLDQTSHKQVANVQALLTIQEYKSILELDERVNALMEEINHFKDIINEKSLLFETNCRKLQPCANILQTTTQVFDIIDKLLELFRIGRRIDRSPVFLAAKPLESQFVHVKKYARHISLAESDKVTQDFALAISRLEESTVEDAKDMIEFYELNYKPIENILAKRPDLPYLKYAILVSRVKTALKTIGQYPTPREADVIQAQVEEFNLDN